MKEEENQDNLGPLYQIYKFDNEIDVYIGSAFEDDSKYFELFTTLRYAQKGDHIRVYLSSVGGHAHTAFRLSQVVKESPAWVTMVVDGPCYSGGAMVALAGDGLLMRPHTFLMFHNWHAEVAEKGAAFVSRIENENRHVREAYKRIGTPFLTDKEFNDIVNDRDVYIHETDPTVDARIKRHLKAHKRY